jgi:hypothetical protein
MNLVDIASRTPLEDEIDFVGYWVLDCLLQFDDI